MDMDFGVNYVAVIVAAVAAAVIGIVYYGIAGFGDRLARLNGTAPRTAPPSPTQFAIGIMGARASRAEPRRRIHRRRHPPRRARVARAAGDPEGGAGLLRGALVERVAD